ncbi:hypothetical protein WICPIJ_006631 [Wickerhamomyces pijperi]|uniref:Uncharacterized protein n=1 Tax=Wickerhamomyces pijperi TaxID=599730 RepID=A0A9P8Q1P7_WICPI|nr:hypothetical protein WICPIJ_006631 [Wickerhamomyces pijperi]
MTTSTSSGVFIDHTLIRPSRLFSIQGLNTGGTTLFNVILVDFIIWNLLNISGPETIFTENFFRDQSTTQCSKKPTKGELNGFVEPKNFENGKMLDLARELTILPWPAKTDMTLPMAEIATTDDKNLVATLFSKAISKKLAAKMVLEEAITSFGTKAK